MSSARGESSVEMYRRSLCINNAINSPDSQCGRRIEQMQPFCLSYCIKTAIFPNSAMGMEEAKADVLVFPAPNRPQTPGEIQLVKKLHSPRAAQHKDDR